jgi:predicted anti-sigma-YlaC factor YlaD
MSAPVAYEIACREVVELVTEYLEATLLYPDRTRFEMHLCLCDGCRAYLRQVRQVVRTASQLGHEPAPPASKEELLTLFREWKRGSGGSQT